ncbi:MAG: hypothetical protein WBS33_15900 [Verrucomicrobiia bacterium]
MKLSRLGLRKMQSCDFDTNSVQIDIAQKLFSPLFMRVLLCVREVYSPVHVYHQYW